MIQYAGIVHKHFKLHFTVCLIIYCFRHKGCLNTENGVLSLSDPFLLADWLEYSKQKLLTLLQDKISTTLHNILQHDEPNSVGDDSNEEACIQVQLDVIQVLGQ